MATRLGIGVGYRVVKGVDSPIVAGGMRDDQSEDFLGNRIRG